MGVTQGAHLKIRSKIERPLKQWTRRTMSVASKAQGTELQSRAKHRKDGHNQHGSCQSNNKDGGVTGERRQDEQTTS
jgi:hypothetical protein